MSKQFILITLCLFIGHAFAINNSTQAETSSPTPASQAMVTQQLQNKLIELNRQLKELQQYNQELTQQLQAQQASNTQSQQLLLQMQTEVTQLKTQMNLQQNAWQRWLTDPMLWIYLAIILATVFLLICWLLTRHQTVKLTSKELKANKPSSHQASIEELLQTAQYDQAETQLSKVLKQNPNDAQSWQHLLQIYVAMDRAEDFKACLNRVPEAIKTQPPLQEKIANWQTIWPKSINKTSQPKSVSKENSYSDIDADNPCAIKLDLAQAYLQMQDYPAARDLLNVVIKEGDESQRQTAQQLLAQCQS